MFLFSINSIQYFSHCLAAAKSYQIFVVELNNIISVSSISKEMSICMNLWKSKTLNLAYEI